MKLRFLINPIAWIMLSALISGCLYPSGEITIITDDPAYGSFRKGQVYLLKQDVLTNGDVIDNQRTLREANGNLRIVSMAEILEDPTLFPDFFILPAGTLLRLEEASYHTAIAMATVGITVTVLNGDLMGTVLTTGGRPFIAGSTMEGDLRANPEWLVIVEDVSEATKDGTRAPVDANTQDKGKLERRGPR